MPASVRPSRRRQDLVTTTVAERTITDRSASELYDQLWLGALRAGVDPNLPEKVVEIEGYCLPTFDAKKGALVSLETRRHLDEIHRHRTEMLRSLRSNKAHMAMDPFLRILKETEYWMGVKEWEGPNSGTKGAKKLTSSNQRRVSQDEHDQDEDDVALHITETPSYIRGRLRDYQLEGVNWLLGLFSRGINGILADEMGLGKTFQTIATIAYLKFTHGLPGPHLIVCPKSVLGNWYREIRQWCPSLNVYKFHCPSSIRLSMIKAHLQPYNRVKYDVIVTTNEMVVDEISAFSKIQWQYLVVDEAHKLKNEEGKLHTSLAVIRANWRLIITGTPLQNNLKELWALLNFLAPSLYTDSKSFQEWFDCAQGVEDAAAVKSMHVMLAPLMLRRMKQDVNTGIPPKKEIYVTCQLSKKQRHWYSTVLAKDAELLNKATGGTCSRLNNVMMHLRKVINHPYLMVGGEDGPPFKTDEWLIKHSGKMIVLDMLLKRLLVDNKHEGNKVLIFSQFTTMLDILEDYCVFRGYKYCRIDGSTSAFDRDSQMASFNSPGGDHLIFLLSTRSGGLGINLQAANNVVLYDSDWNPQMDLQAQDRAHRIGQQRSVRIYRLIVDGTMEERMYKRALKKLYLDAMVVQQGRLQANAKSTATAEELLSMVRFGAEEIFKSRGQEITDADIDQLLNEGETKLNELTNSIKASTQVSLASFKLGADEANMYDFEGVSYGNANAISESKVVHCQFSSDAEPISQDELYNRCAKYGEVVKAVLHPNLTEALVTFRTVIGATDAMKALHKEFNWTCSYAIKEVANVVSRDMIDECFATEKLGRGQRVREPVKFYTVEDVAKLTQKREKAPPLKMPRPPSYPYWQLYNNKRLTEIHNTEVALLVRNWRQRHDKDESTVVLNDNGEEVQQPVVEDLTLTAAELEEKDRLLGEGFPHWTHAEFRCLRSAVTSGKVGLRDYKTISELIGSKTEGEVRDYLSALYERGARCVPQYARFEEAIARSQKKIDEHEAMLRAVRWKVESANDLERDLKLIPRSAFPQLDRKLFLLAYDNNLVVPNVGQIMKGLPELRFDIYYQSRGDDFYTKRLSQLLLFVKKEHEKPAEGDNDVSQFLRKKRPREDNAPTGAEVDCGGVSPQNGNDEI